jgi:hypothetical protein
MRYGVYVQIGRAVSAKKYIPFKAITWIQVVSATLNDSPKNT